MSTNILDRSDEKVMTPHDIMEFETLVMALGRPSIEFKRNLGVLKQAPDNYNYAGTLHVNVCEAIRRLTEIRDRLESIHGFKR